jgi:hypothetical protein
MRSALTTLALLVGGFLPGGLGAAQDLTYSVSGRVVQKGETTGIPGATVRLSGRFTRLSGPGGEFEFARVPEGAYTLTVEAMGYRAVDVSLVLRSDTTLFVEMEIDPIIIDSLMVQAGTVTVRGKVLDGVTGRSIPEARIQTGIRSEVYSLSDGSFRLKDLPRGFPVSVTVGAYRYLPDSQTLVAYQDTTLSVTLSPDSVAIRLFQRATEQLEIRARGVNLSQVQLSRDFIERRIYHTLTDLIRVKTGGRVSTRCLFIDEVSQPFFDVLDTYQASEIERIEVFGRGKMIRVYTQDFVARNLTKVEGLPPVVYVMPGVCF